MPDHDLKMNQEIVVIDDDESLIAAGDTRGVRRAEASLDWAGCGGGERRRVAGSPPRQRHVRAVQRPESDPARRQGRQRGRDAGRLHSVLRTRAAVRGQLGGEGGKCIASSFFINDSLSLFINYFFIADIWVAIQLTKFCA